MKKTLFSVLLLLNLACVSAYVQSVGGNTSQDFNRIYLTDPNTAWQAALEALKNSHLEVSNREGGYIQTKWTDNTTEKNFADSFGTTDAYLKAQYRFRVAVAKGFYNGKPTVRMNVQKEQLVQRDVLEGWIPIETDGIDETTLLYRIGRIIQIKTKITRLEDERVKRELENVDF